MTTRTVFKGSASKRCVSRTPAQKGKAVCKVGKLQWVCECMNNYEYYINFLSYLVDLSAKQHAREDCASVELENHRKEHQRRNA